jgi:hypothetical protein
MPRSNSNNKTPAWLAQAQIDLENHPNQEIQLAMQLPEALARQPERGQPDWGYS